MIRFLVLKILCFMVIFPFFYTFKITKYQKSEIDFRSPDISSLCFVCCFIKNCVFAGLSNMCHFLPNIAEGDVTKVVITPKKLCRNCLFLHIRCKIDAREGLQNLVTISFTV